MFLRFFFYVYVTKGENMRPNEGRLDRVVRVIIGIGVLSLVFVGPQTAWGYLGAVPLLTGLVGICPLYSVLGINTCSVSNKPMR
jgi:hypothetical protein